MGNDKSQIAYIRYAGFSTLDTFERARIEKIVLLQIEKIKRIAPVLGMRLHLKSVHEKATEVAKQGHTHEVDAVLETAKGHFSARVSHRNPYSAVADVMENLLRQLKHKHPHKDEWKEMFKGDRKFKGRKT